MFDFFFIIGFAGFGWATQNIVIPALRTLYLVFCFAVGFSYLDLRKTIPETALPVVLVLSHKTSNRVYSGSDFKKRLTLDKSINKKQYPSAAYFKELVFPDGGISNEKKTPTKKSDAVKTGTETASANSGALSNLLNKLRPSSTAPMSKLIPIKCIEDDKFKMQDDSYMDIVQIVTKDLNSASESDLEALIAAWARMYRTNGFDIKLVSLNTPTDTRGQQHYIQKKIAQNKVPIYDYILREMETQLENVQETRTDRQYYILLFAESQDDYFYALSRISQTLIYNDLARKMSLPAKLAVLEKLNNKSQTIQVQNATKVNITYPEKMTDVQIRQKIEKLGYDPWLLEAIQPKGGLRPVNERVIETGCGYEACITVSKFPARVEEFWLTRLMNMDNIVCVIDINTEDPNISKKNINAGMREQERRAEDASDTTVKKTAAQRYAELNALWDDIDVMGEVLKLVKVRIFVEGRTYDECDKRVKSVLDRLDAAGYEASIFLNEEINDFRSVYLPYTKQQELEEAKVYARYGQPLESITLADGIPFHFTNLVDPTGTYLGSTSLGGTVLFDMHTQTTCAQHIMAWCLENREPVNQRCLKNCSNPWQYAAIISEGLTRSANIGISLSCLAALI